ncbi:MAG TPA: hypothetical protein VF190_00340 [Rhodothermales bacterium]
MTALLERAIARLADLPEVEQDVIAALILREIEADRRIPFHIPEVNSLHEGKGFVWLEDEFLVFRFTVLDFGVTERGWETVKVERPLIDGIRTQRGLLKDKLLIATRNQRLLEAIPGDHNGEISLRTKKQEREQVQAFVERVLAWRRAQLTRS